VRRLLQRLASWASGETSVGPVGALRLATDAEAAGIPIGASTFLLSEVRVAAAYSVCS
jgi:hypothetical protein